jgi:iron complex outermembrane receptor protein
MQGKNNKKRNIVRSVSLVLITPSCFSTAAQGQEISPKPKLAQLGSAATQSPAPQAIEPEESNASLDEIVVTAERRETNLQDTPVSISALTGETLTAIGIKNLEDFQFFVPGISVTNDSMAIVNIRGIGTSAFGVATDPSSTVHYDGVYISRPTTSYQDLYDVERIELLRGPQGVLFGRNSAGGTLLITSKAPSRTLEGTVALTLGNYDKRTLSGTLSGPLTDGVRGRVTLLRNTRDGIYRDPVSRKRYQDEDNYAVRGTVAVDVTDAFDLVLRGDYSREDETGYPSVRESYPAEFAAAGAFIPTRRRDLALNTQPVNDVKAGGVSATANYNFGGATLRSITAFRQSDVAQVLDVDSTTLFLRDITFDERSKTFTQELQLLSDAGGRFNWIVGAFYLNERGRDQIQIIEPGRLIAIPETNVTNAYALFGQATYGITDRARLTAGLRYSYEKKNFAYQVFVDRALAVGETPKDSWKSLTPKFVLDYELSDDVLAYASATRGFKSGGFQLGDGKPFLPEDLWSYEVGLKSELFDRRVRVNAGAFYYDYSNLQVVQFVNGVATTTNAGKATIKGGEIEFTAQPTRDLNLNASLAYLDARYDVFFDQQVSLEGKRLPNTPKFNVTFGTQYGIDLNSLGRLTLRGDVAYRSRVFFKPNNDPRFGNGDYVLVNSRIALNLPGDRWEAAIYGRNLTDTRYATYRTVGTDTTGVSNPALPLAVFGEPRQYGVQLRYSF